MQARVLERENLQHRLICKIIYVTKLMNFKKSFAKIIYVKVLNYSNIYFILGEV